jgi:tetratricopeptide (TPR) repeat protein
MHTDISTLFGELSDLTRDERERYYREHSISIEMRGEVESLLAFDGGTQIRSVVHKAVGLAFHDPAANGEHCGQFQLLRQIGRGGMGVVYLAERTDGEVRQLVAVKLLRSSLDSSEARQRFLQERQILANLTHPHIARMIDAGHRPDGRPYLVMEYIDGQPIDQFAEGLSTRKKVALTAMVCDAIASAHQKLVVHRDLKPGNILVDGSCSPRVLDFGIAKWMDEASETATVERRLTPEYASPEQIAGAPATTATDIYSIGAVLYKLLTGAGPSRRNPPAPGRAGAQSDRDLDAIVLKALREEPEERYSTADKFAEDLRAWLARKPVAARQGERWYRARRQLRRYWLPAVAGTVAAAGLVGGLLLARAQRDEAQQRFEEVRNLANEFFAVEKEVQALPGSTAVRERIVRTSIQYLEKLSKRAGKDWRLKAEIAAGYRKAAEAQGVSRGTNLGRPKDAQESLRKAAVLLQEARAAAPDDRGVLHDLIELVELQSRAEDEKKDLKALEAKVSDLRALVARYEATAPSQPFEWQFLGKMYESMAMSAKEFGPMDLPMEFARRSVELRRMAVEHEPAFDARGSLSNALSAYATLHVAVGDMAGAVEIYKESLAVLEAMAAENPDHYKTQMNIANAHALIGRRYGSASGPGLRQHDLSIRHLEESVRIGRRILSWDANDRHARLNFGISLWRLGDELRTQDPARAVASYDEAATVLRAVTPSFVRDVALVAVISESTLALKTLGRDAEIPGRLKEVSSICGPHRGKPTPVYNTCSEYPSRVRGALAMAEKRPREAVAAYREWFESAENASGMEEVHNDLFSAWALLRHYRMTREAEVAAGWKADAAATDRKIHDVMAMWKPKLKGPNDIDLLLGP